MLGQAKLALCFQIPLQASLHGILKSIAHYATQMALRLHLAQKSLGENAGLRLVSKRGCVVKKHPQARLRGSFLQDIQHSRSGNERYMEEVIEILRDIQSPSKRNLYQPGYQNILPRWQFSQSQGGHAEWVMVKYFDDWYLDIVKFWDDFFDSIKWKLANLSYLPISLLKFLKRGCKRVK